MRKIIVFAAAAGLVIAAAVLVEAQLAPLQLVRVKFFGGLPNLPIYVGQKSGFFAKQGL